MQPPLLWAHRGASAWAPENTLSAFSLALEGGADGLELDIHLSRDGVPVVIHDETVDRTTDGHGAVANLTLPQLQRLDAGSWFKDDFAGESIPSLEDVLEAFGGLLRLNLELKEFRAGMAVRELLARYPAADIVISSFNYSLLRRLRAEDSAVPLAVLYEAGGWHRALSLATELRAQSFHPRADLVCRPMITACRRAGLLVYAWTVDAPEDIRSLVRAGANGVFTNDPLQKRWPL